MNYLRIIGTGISGLSHLTYQAQHELVNSKKVLLFFSPVNLQPFLAEKNIPFEVIDNLYFDGAVDNENYERIKARVYKELGQHGDIVFCLPGHPRLGVTIVKHFQRDQDRLGFRLSVSPGISSFDTMINDLELDPLERGTAILDANLMLLLDYKLEPLMNHLVYHVCSVGTTRTHISDPSKDNSLSFLRKRLLEYFPPSHIVKLISSSSNFPGECDIIEVTIDQLESLLSRVTFNSSLFVPGLKPVKERINLDFLSEIRREELVNESQL